MNEIRVAAGQRVAVIRRSFSSVPLDYRFAARAEKPGQAISGIVEVRKSRWILPGAPSTQPLQAKNVVSAGFWNTFMSVDVVPEVDAMIAVEGRSLRNAGFLLVLAGVVVAAAVAILVMFRT